MSTEQNKVESIGAVSGKTLLVTVFLFTVILLSTLYVMDNKCKALKKEGQALSSTVATLRTGQTRAIEVDRRTGTITLTENGSYVESGAIGHTNYTTASSIFSTGTSDTSKVPDGTWGFVKPERVFGPNQKYIVQVHPQLNAHIQKWAKSQMVFVIFR